MLDLGLSKLAIIGVVALVVIGPEKLPRVARTVGALMGRAQRYVNDVKSEVAREMDLGDLKNARSQFEEAARDMHSSVNDNIRQTEDHLNETWRSLSPDPVPGGEAANALPLPSNENPSGYSVYDETAAEPSAQSEPSVYRGADAVRDGVYTRSDTDGGGSGGGSAVRRRNWRVKQAAPPAWFKRTQLVRTRLQSGAARVARHRPDSLREPTRFL